jgi:hypothetical protein
MSQTKVITDKVEYKSTIKAIDQGKDWEGGDKIVRTEYTVHMANGHAPVFNIKSTKANLQRAFPYSTGNEVVYLLTEKEMFNKIRQFGTLDMEKTDNLKLPKTEQKLTQQESIALSVASKLGFETVTSDAWQSTLKLKGKSAEETQQKQAAAQSQLLSSIGQVTIAYYNLLTSKPQNNEQGNKS